MISITLIIFWPCLAIYCLFKRKIKMALIFILLFRSEIHEELIKDLQHKVELIEVVK
jgi:hypothetical protein